MNWALLYATAASVHEATGYPVAVAFDAGNMLPVAKHIRQRLPDIRIVLCADDDCRTEGNPGITKAREAANAVNGIVAIPDFGDARPDGATDFNDLAQAQGLAAVSENIREAVELADAYTGPPVAQVIAATKKFLDQAKQGEFDEAFGVASVRLFGAATGLPATQLIRTYRGWNAWAEGDAPATSILFGPPPRD